MTDLLHLGLCHIQNKVLDRGMFWGLDRQPVLPVVLLYFLWLAGPVCQSLIHHVQTRWNPRRHTRSCIRDTVWMKQSHSPPLSVLSLAGETDVKQLLSKRTICNLVRVRKATYQMLWEPRIWDLAWSGISLKEMTFKLKDKQELTRYGEVEDGGEAAPGRGKGSASGDTDPPTFRFNNSSRHIQPQALTDVNHTPRQPTSERDETTPEK